MNVAVLAFGIVGRNDRPVLSGNDGVNGLADLLLAAYPVIPLAWVLSGNESISPTEPVSFMTD